MSVLFDIGMIRGLGTVVVLVAFIGLVLWAYSGRRATAFQEAALLPFKDQPSDRASSVSRSIVQ
jgi:cytochrome c oxidase cbb3-type subunit 4